MSVMPSVQKVPAYASLAGWLAQWWPYVAALVLLLGGSLLHYQRGYYFPGAPPFHGQGTDDAYISYRYGWNLAQYGRLAWNESGYRQTEGFTNPLWVGVSAAWSLLGHKDWVHPLVVLTSVLGAGLLLCVLMRAVCDSNGGRTSSLLGLVLAAAPVLWLHVTSGLESGLFGIALATAAYLVLVAPYDPSRRGPIMGLAVLVCLLRADGFVYLGIVAVSALLAGHPGWQPLGLATTFTTGAATLARLAYFGALVPNTAIAKLNFDVWQRLPWGLTILWLSIGSGLGACLVLGGLGLARQPVQRRLSPAVVLAGWLAYFVYLGGDLYLERHLVGVFVFAAALSAPLWLALPRPWRAGALALAAVFVMALPLLTDARFHYTQPKPRDPWVMLGQALAEDRERFGVVLTNPAGKIPFFAGGDFIDAYGLNDPELAARPRDRFVTGHSAGDDELALALAQAHPAGVHARFGYAGAGACPTAGGVALWVNNWQPQAVVQRAAAASEVVEACASSDVYYWSYITQPER